MTLKLTKRLATALLCSIMLYLPAQQPGALKDKEHEVELKQAARFLNDGPSTLSENDLEIISAYNFESYRKDNTRLKIQLVKGPLLELLSQKELKAETPGKRNAHGKSLEENMDLNKTDELILQLNIGLGYAKKQHAEVYH